MKKVIVAISISLYVMHISVALGQSPLAEDYRIMPVNPMADNVEILYGDPEKPGHPFVMRIRELAGGLIPPHKHPVDEHITVVRGSIFFGVGERFDPRALKEVKTGGYVFIPKGTTMFGYTPDAAIVQVHGEGPFHIHWRSGSEWRKELKTLDSPDAGRIFEFRKGDLVSTPRGSGRVRQGYDSGEIIGYEITSLEGSLFMAEECEMSLTKAGKNGSPASSEKTCFSKSFRGQQHLR